MRDYQRETNNPYHLPHNLWRQTLYQIRDYNRLKDEADSIADLSAISTEINTGGSVPGDTVGNKVAQRERYMNVIKAIDTAKSMIPTEYQRGIWRNILYGEAFPNDADRSTYARHKSRFVYMVAYFLGWV